MQTLLPEGWPRPSGYSLGIAAEGRQVHVAGLIGWLPDGSFPSDKLGGQVRQALQNTVDVLAEAGAGPEHVVRQTWYIRDRDAYIAEISDIGSAWKDIMGKNFPAMAVIEISRLIESKALVEIETYAILPTDK